MLLSLASLAGIPRARIAMRREIISDAVNGEVEALELFSCRNCTWWAMSAMASISDGDGRREK